MKNGGYALLSLLFITYLVDSVFRAAPSALSNVLMPEFSLSYSAAGLVMSIYLVPYALMQVPNGIISDRWGPRQTRLLFLAITISGNLAFWAARGYGMLLLGQIIIGLGSSIIYINAVKLIEKRLPASSLGRGLGVLSAASPMGSFIAYSGFPLLYSALGAWRPVYLGFTIVMAGVLILDSTLLRSPSKNERWTPSTSSMGMLKSIASNRALLPLFIGYLISGFNWCFWSWMPKFLIDTKGFSYLQAGLISGTPTVASIAGCVLVGAVSDWLRSRKLPLAAFATLDTLMLMLIIFLPTSTPIGTFLVSAALLGFASAMWVLPYAMVAEALPSEFSGVGLGLLNFLGYVGSIVMIPLFGALIDRTGSYALSNQIVVAIALVVVLFYAIPVKETYPKN